MNTSTCSISVSTVMTVLADGASGPVDAELGYRVADPYAVFVAFPEDGVEWVVGRDLVAEGLSRSAGVGDVRVGPDPFVADDTLVELESPGGRASLQVRTAVLVDFLRRTAELVPFGAEGGRLDIDLIVARLVGSNVG